METSETQNGTTHSDSPNVEDRGAASVVSSLGHDDHDSFMTSDYATTVLTSQGKPTYKLDLRNIKLVGRGKELATLKDCYDRVSQGKKNGSEFVFIGGESGTGKSALAEALREPVMLHGGNGFFVTGKFEKDQREPFCALVQAFSDLCDLVAQSKTGCHKITAALEGELPILHSIIPNLSRLTGHNTHDYDDGSVLKTGGKHGFTKLKQSCRRFLSAIASKKHPVVLHLGNLQWADKGSVDLIGSLLRNKKSKFLMFIITQSGNPGCMESLLHYAAVNANDCLPCTNLEVGNLTLEDLTCLVSDVTETESSKAAELAALVLHRTNGNPFFVIKFLELMRDSKLIQYDYSSCEWTWSLSQIQNETNVCDNVLEIITKRVNQLKVQVQVVLRLASVQGAHFDRDVIKAVASREKLSIMSERPDGKNMVDISLKVAEKQGLIETMSDGSLRFCHDRIQDCMYAMIPRGQKRAVLHLAVARSLQQMEGGERFAFSIADQLYRAKMLLVTDDDILDFGQSSLLAAKLAMRKAAFSIAARYVARAIDLMNVATMWEDLFYESSLNLHLASAEASFCCGHVDDCNTNLEEVFKHARSNLDASRAYTIQVYSLGAQARLDEAIATAFAAARGLGIKIPKNPTMRQAVWQIIKTKASLRWKSDADLLALPTQCNAESEAAFKLLALASHYAAIAMKTPHLCLSIVSMLRIVIKGRASAPSVFCSYGLLEAAVGNISEAVRMGRLALELQGSQTRPNDLPSTLSLAHTSLLHWRIPFRDSLDPLLEGYTSGMENGDYEAGFMAMQAYMMMAIFSGGSPLIDLEQKMRQYCMLISELDHKVQLYLSLPYWQLCLNLLGFSDSPTMLIGEAMDQKLLQNEDQYTKVALAPQTLNTVRIVLAYHFEDVESLMYLLAEYDSFESNSVGHFMVYVVKFYVGMGYMVLYRIFVKRSYKEKARKIARQLRKWTRDGCINTRPLAALLEAELKTVDTGSDEFLAAFYDAIHAARDSQNVCLEALAHERISRFLHYDEARQHMDRALDLYGEWGASAKVAHLEKSFHWLQGDVGTPLEIVTDNTRE
jgi:predicted ATPase